MPRLLLIVVIIAVAVGGALWLLQRDRSPALPSRAPSTPQLPDGVTARAALVFGVDRGPGTLRLTDSQLVFDGDSGRVVVLDRWDIVGVSASRDLPDRTTAAEVLVVATTTDTYYWQVDQPRRWVDALT